MSESKNIDTDTDNKRKRSDHSSVSDLDTSTNSPLSAKGRRKQRKKELSEKTNTDILVEDTSDTVMEAIRKELIRINEILSKVLTKDDPHLENLIKTLFNSMKDDFLKSVSHRIDVLEHKTFEKDQENDKLKEIVKDLEKKVDEKHEENSQLQRELGKVEQKMQDKLNDIEQYSRKNNIRIDGLEEPIAEDAEKTATSVIDTLNKHMKDVIKLKRNDIDIAHRLGQNKNGKRQIIVKFVSRRPVETILKNKKKMKGTGIFINEDLTRTNQMTLMSVKRKQPDEIENAWTVDGRISYKNKMGTIHTLKYEDYQSWFDLPWPEKKSTK